MDGEGTVQGRQGVVTFRPYRDIKSRPLKKRFVETNADDEEEPGLLGAQRTAAEDLYPEILCHVFSLLDTAAKGRAAQVTSPLTLHPTPCLGGAKNAKPNLT
jgi:hypothetical protein